MEGIETPPPDFKPPSPGSPPGGHSGSISTPPSPRQRRRPSTSVEPSDSSEMDQETGLSKKQFRALRRMLPAGMIQKQLRQPPPPRRSRSTTAPLPPEHSPPTFQVIPGRAKTTRYANPGAGPKHVIEGDLESSDERRSTISVSSSGRSISDVEELRSRTFPGVLDLSLDSSDETNVSDVDDANVIDADIDAWVHRKPVNLRPDYGDFGEAEEGDLIDRMLSRTTVSRRRAKKSTKNATLNLPVVKHGHRKRKKPTNIYVHGSRAHHHSRQLRIPDMFGPSEVNKRARGEVKQRSAPRGGGRVRGQFPPPFFFFFFLLQLLSDANTLTCHRGIKTRRKHRQGTFYRNPIAPEEEATERANISESQLPNDSDSHCYRQATRKRHEPRTRGRVRIPTPPAILLPQ